MKIDIERYNKSTMPENAEKYFYGPTGIRTHDLVYIYMRRFGEYTSNRSNRHNISVALDPHGTTFQCTNGEMENGYCS